VIVMASLVVSIRGRRSTRPGAITHALSNSADGKG
jgi:hypothetical protein